MQMVPFLSRWRGRMNKYSNVDYRQIDEWVDRQPWSMATRKNRRTIIARAMSLVNSGLAPQQAYEEIARGTTYGPYVASTLEPFFVQHGYGAIARAGRREAGAGQDGRAPGQRNFATPQGPGDGSMAGAKQSGMPWDPEAPDSDALASRRGAGGRSLDDARSKILYVLEGDPDGLRIFGMMEADIGAVDGAALRRIAHSLKGGQAPACTPSGGGGT